MDLRKFVLLLLLMFSPWVFSKPYGEVVFSELMVDPEPTVGLPAVEYVEIYNRTDRPLSFRGWKFFYGEMAYDFPDSRVDAGGYCLLCSRKAGTLLPLEINKALFESFPALANSGKMIYLTDEQGAVITCLEYDDNWHENGFKANGGWSLECKDVDNLSGLPSNWTSSADPSGGTPGRANAVSRENPDEVLPLCTGLFVPASNQIELNFSKIMQPEKLASLQNYRLLSQDVSISSIDPVFPPFRSVVLNLKEPLEAGAIYDLELLHLEDVSGLSTASKSIPFGLPEEPDSSDLRLNEVLFNPVPNGCDYVEFVNVSGKCVDLSRVWLASLSASGELSAGIRLSEKPLPCVPQSYWILSVCSDTVAAIHGGAEIPHAIDLPSFPSMPDESGHVMLLTSSAQVIDEMEYEASMHFPLMSSAEGVSLEKLHPECNSMERSSWRSASSASGYGTPGYQNSQYRDLNDTVEGGFTIPNAWITPDNDGKNDYMSIQYEVKESSLANLTIFDLEGRIIRNLANNELLAAKGMMVWDGTNDEGEVVPFGRYILQADYFTPSGKRNKKRFVLAVLF